ncbi:MAG TPA: apolipoprotein N-acyltransferase [Geobacteraceae bacterium]|nr:apolipoprotein N-acyltransferase [Geobacteraceae bacterium]
MPRNFPIKDTLPWLAALASGVLYFLGYAGFDHFYLEWFSLVPLLWAIRGQRPGRAFLMGWAAGITAHAGGFYWVTWMFREFAGASWLPSCLGLFALAALNGMVFALWACGVRLIAGNSDRNLLWVCPVVWTAVEKLWPEVFPNYLGASQYQLAHLTQIADLTGILGVSFLVVFINTTVFTVIGHLHAERRFPWRQGALCATVLLAVLAYGEFRIRAVDRQAAAADKLTIGLIQTNRGAGDKRSDFGSLLLEHQEMSRTLAANRPLDLVVWPESVCGMELDSRDGQLPPGVLDGLQIPVLFGSVLRLWQGETPRLYNSAVLADSTGAILGTYDKMVLVPFGEYIPCGETFPQLYSWLPATGRFRPGENVEPLQFHGHYISVNICYEDIFPGQIRSLMEGGRAHRIPEAMFNLTNDSWYGKSVEPMEHLALASFRAIEHRRPLVRATNTGISAFVDPVGRLAMRSGLWTREVLVDRVPMMQGRTVYARLGDWLGWLCVCFAGFGIVRAIMTSRHPATVS